MGCYVEDVIKVARAEVGYLEKKSNSQLDSKTANAGSNNYTKYARDMDNISGFYNGKKNGFAWCDVFVDWCFNKAFGTANAKRLLCQPDKSCGAGCQYSMNYYKGKGQFYTSPKIGDQIFFKNASGSRICHTGLVYAVDKTYVYTVEGNTSSASGVVANGGCVREKKYKLNYSRIAGYGRPKYDVKAATSNSTTVSVKEAKVGDIVEFTGYIHYSSSNATKGYTCKPGKAKVNAIYPKGKHPYSLIRVSGGGSTVYGWVDAKDIGATNPTATATQTVHTVVKGDSLWSLAVKYLGNGARYNEIMTLNGKKTTTLTIGEKLKIPKK